MLCSPTEIAKKRQIAIERLAKRKAVSSPNANSPFLPNPGPVPQGGSPSPRKSNFNHNAKPYAKPVVQFYGKDKVITGKCSLLNQDRFVVKLAGFSTPAIEQFKTISTRNYNVQTKDWDFHFKDHDLLMSKLQQLQPSVVIEGLPKFVVKVLKQEQINDPASISLEKLDPELGAALMPFQQEGVRFGVDKNGRCMIADDMGLGKTFQALGIAHYYQTDWPLLIVTTASMKNIWEETIHTYLPTVPLMYIQYMTSGKDYIGDCKVLIVSHDMMTRYVSKLLERKFGVLVIDESHNLKNFKAKCTKAATELAKRAKRVVLLSGTPALSRPSELYSQLALIDDKFFGTFFDFSRRYCDGKTTSFGWDASGKSNLQELEIILAKKFMIRRTKDDVLKTLPDKIQEVVTLDVKLNEFSKEDKATLNALAERYQSVKKGNEKHALLLTFFAETAKIKIPSVCSYILQVLQSKQKFLVFAHHKKMLDAIEKVLHKKNVKFIRIDGNSNSEQRKHYVDKFQLQDNYLVALLSITAANAGITLTAAQLVIFAELHWNPSILSQAESRAHRIGQTKPVVVNYLLAPGTADDSIWPMLQEKQRILSEIGLSRVSLDSAAVTKQRALTENLDFSFSDSLNLNRTVANTLDITSYFKEPNTSTSEDFCNDGCDELFSNIDIKI